MLAIGTQAAALVAVLLTRSVVGVLRSDHLGRLPWYVAAVLGLGVVRAVMMAGRRLIAGQQALYVEMDMRTAIYAKLVRLSFGFYDRHQTGQLMSRATVDLQGVRFFLGYGLIFFFQHVFTIVGVGIIVFILSWKLALVTLAIAPVLVVVAYRYSHVSHPLLRDVQQKMADVATVAEENIVGVHVVKAFAREDTRAGEVRGSAARRVFVQSVKANRQRAFYIPMLSFLPLLAQAAILLFGGRMVARGTLSLDDFVAVQPLPGDARGAAALARHVDRPGAARDRVGRADLPGDRRARGHPRRPGGRACSRPARAGSSSTT